jgi:F0F1-type ATP synthase membrane subunit c/vacuolar-type H+-ATPase subunit K
MLINGDSELRKAFRVTVVIGLVMMASVLIYAVVAEIIKKQNAPFSGFSPLPPDVFTTLRYALLAVAVIQYFIIQFLNKVMLSSNAPAMGTVSPAGSSTPLISASVVAFALSESVAVYGLVLFLIQGDSTDFYLFLMISLIYFTIYFPKYEKWEEWVREREKGARG